MKKPEKSYCYVSTNDPDVARRSKEYCLAPVRTDGLREVYFSAPEDSSDRYISVINNIGDYDPDNIREWLKSDTEGNPGFDSLVSAAFLESDGLLCTGDFFGINTHYWHFDEKTFCCSDNIFAVAWLTGSNLSRESLWEYLFFLCPIKERTWFEAISRLRPGQSISYSSCSHDLSISEPYDLFGILTGADGPDMNEAITLFFESAKRVLDGRRAAVSISAGSDSNTVLSCVRGVQIPLKGYSFGTPLMVETRKISENAKRLGFDWELIDTTKFSSSWINRFRRTLLCTNGLLNPYRTHYEEFFSDIPSEAPVFEGVLGSELVKGEYAVGSTVGKAHLGTITSNLPIGEIIERVFPELPEPFRKDMSDYISDVHGGWLNDVNTEAGASDFRSFILEFATGRTLAGMILQGAETHDMYEPFASPMILGAIYRSNLGIARDLSIIRNHREYARVIEAEAMIVRQMDKDVYNNVLDRGVSFREVLTYPDWLLRVFYRYRGLLLKYKEKKYIWAQVDNREVFQDTHNYAASLSGRHELIDILIQGDKYDKESTTLGMILDVLGENQVADNS